MPKTNPPPPDQTAQLSDSLEGDINNALKSASVKKQATTQTVPQNQPKMSIPGTLAPEPFYGKPAESADLWLLKFENFAEYQKLDQFQMPNAFSMLLRDGAYQWLSTLPETTRKSWNSLKTAFTDRYMVPDCLLWSKVGDLFTESQRPDQTVRDFMEFIIRRGAESKVPDAQVIQAILRGLNPSVRQYIVPHEPKTIADLLKHAKLAEASQVNTPDTKNDTVMSAINALSTRIDNLTVNQAQVMSAVNQRMSRSSTPPRRVSFQDGREQDRDRYRSSSRSPSPAPWRRNNSRDRRPQQWQRSNNQRNYKGKYSKPFNTHYRGSQIVCRICKKRNHVASQCRFARHN